MTNSKFGLSLLGSIMVAVSVFLPSFSIAIGSVAFLRSTSPIGYLVLGIAILNIVLGYLNRYALSRYSSFLLLALIIFGFIDNLRFVMDSKADLSSVLGGLSGGLLDSYHLDWGWIPLFLGSALVSIVHFLSEENLIRINKVIFQNRS